MQQRKDDYLRPLRRMEGEVRGLQSVVEADEMIREVIEAIAGRVRS
ncbi:MULTISPECIES: metal-sensing transcriptional repressor [Geodermatophilaceae]|nr:MULTISPECIES: metal-sensing transcriptional repressor [Geodermatophilaceae]